LSHKGIDDLVTVVGQISTNESFVIGKPITVGVVIAVPRGLYNYLEIQVLPNYAYSLTNYTIYGAVIHLTNVANSSAIEAWAGAMLSSFIPLVQLC
jgi:hypothetical protein